MNRRSFFATLFAPLAAKLLPRKLPTEPTATYLDPYYAVSRGHGFLRVERLQAGDTFTISGVYARNPETREFEVGELQTFRLIERRIKAAGDPGPGDPILDYEPV